MEVAQAIGEQSNAKEKIQAATENCLAVAILGRLACDEKYKGHGLRRDLLQVALTRILQVSNIIGVRAFPSQSLASGVFVTGFSISKES
jgi:hypothetical protein